VDTAHRPLPGLLHQPVESEDHDGQAESTAQPLSPQVSICARSLPRLHFLETSGGRKLTRSGILAAVTSNNSPEDAPAEAAPRHCSLASLVSQRCFQLGASALDTLLSPMAQPLHHLALSHLDLGPWSPKELGAGPRQLVLGNSLRLGPEALAYLSALARLELLSFGGSVLQLQAFTQEPVAEAVKAAYVQPPFASAAAVAAHLGAASALVALAERLPRLRAVDLTFLPPPVTAAVRQVLSTRPAGPVAVWDLAACPEEHTLAARRLLDQDSRPADSAARTCATSLLRCLVSCSNSSRSTPLHAAAERGAAGGVARLLAAGSPVDARDVGGGTPLFLASYAGHAGAATQGGLLRAAEGASTPCLHDGLMTVCAHAHLSGMRFEFASAEVVELLLAAGADVMQPNAAGERPLYIASLRGHVRTVEVRLRERRERAQPGM
jgi:hypothetical protein